MTSRREATVVVISKIALPILPRILLLVNLSYNCSSSASATSSVVVTVKAGTLLPFFDAKVVPRVCSLSRSGPESTSS